MCPMSDSTDPTARAAEPRPRGRLRRWVPPEEPAPGAPAEAQGEAVAQDAAPDPRPWVVETDGGRRLVLAAELDVTIEGAHLIASEPGGNVVLTLNRDRWRWVMRGRDDGGEDPAVVREVLGGRRSPAGFRAD